ncbi:mycofactocin biosynthesis glycosyltransferase MftF [Williamsia sterculiae]|uniref:Mycofactocin system glycosyltransferase n=1 Tax=Williamsia sterculiae TaxID=1344003 RepID=A0A1N7GQA9_9NOCA|nr:mycofactocin biosynthesis glycosyltransferase MftF [Williamsia sterculiae]SIS14797.1 mycofactocin system glycosyltransferase [Williamsia sterculiae]
MTCAAASDARTRRDDLDLPVGFQVQVDLAAVVGGDRRRLLGGSPPKLMRLSEHAASRISADGRLRVADPQSALLARALLTAGVAHPRPMFGPSTDEVTVVIPVRDNQSGLDRLLAALSGRCPVIVVDDGSVTPVDTPIARVIRVDRSLGPAAARNAGAAAADTAFLAFLDSDVVPTAGWLDVLLTHFSDPTVALVAPRIVPLRVDGGPALRYQALCSSLDMGRVEAPVSPGTPVPSVSAAAMVVRRSAFTDVGGFDESMRAAEDVDLCWRLAAVGAAMRYEPIATAAHDHRDTLVDALVWRRHHGTGAALLTDRHRRLAAPVVLSRPMVLVAAGLMSRSTVGLVLAVGMAVVVAARARQRVVELPDAWRAAAVSTVRSMGLGLLQLASALCRAYWPLSIGAAVVSRRARRTLITLAVAEAGVEWVRTELLCPEALPRLGLPMFFAVRRLDDLAYGTGVWQGALHRRRVNALLPSTGPGLVGLPVGGGA